MKYKKLNWSIFSQYRDELYGISIISIIIFHYFETLLDSGVTGIARHIGTLYNLIVGSKGVDLFLFISGACICHSLKKGSHGIMKFYWRRIVRVILPYLLLGGVFWVIKDFVINKQMDQFIQDYFLISFWKKGTRVMWYVALILFLYALSPIIYSIVQKLDEKSWILPAIVILVLICISHLFPAWFNDCEIALLRIPIYLFGFIYSERIMKAEAVKSSDIILLMMFIPIDILCYFTNSRFTRLGHGLFIIFLILLLASFYSLLGKKEKGEKMLAWFGTMSYELYLVHVLGRNICNSLHLGLENLLYYIIFIMICVPISKLLSHVFHVIQLRITA